MGPGKCRQGSGRASILVDEPVGRIFQVRANCVRWPAFVNQLIQHTDHYYCLPNWLAMRLCQAVSNLAPSRGDDRGLTDEDAERRLGRRRLPTRPPFRVFYTPRIIRARARAARVIVRGQGACGYRTCNRNTQQSIPTIVSTRDVGYAT